MKKIITLMLAAAMLLSACATTETSSEADTSTDANTSSGDTESSEAEEMDEDVERMEITMFDIWAVNVEDGNYAESLIEAKFPVDIVVEKVDSSNAEQVNLMLASGDMPDITWISKTVAYMQEEELTRTIPVSMVEEYAPTFIETYDANPAIYSSIVNAEDPAQFDALNGIQDASARVALGQVADFYRYDWILNLGIDLGVEVEQLSDNVYVAENGITLDKFSEIMEAFTTMDPDGDGADDTYGASLVGRSRIGMQISGFGLIEGVVEENGEAEMYYATEGYKEYIRYFADLYAKGYIDPEWVTQSRDVSWEKVRLGNAGYFTESSVALNSWAMDRPPLSLIAEDPNAVVLVTPGLTDNEGNSSVAKITLPTRGPLCFIPYDVEDDKLAMILQVLEYMNFGEDKTSMFYGEEGVDWEMVDGEVNVINDLAPGDKGVDFYAQNTQTGAIFDVIYMQDVFEAGAAYWLDDSIWAQKDTYQYKQDLRNETEYNNLYAENNGDITTVVDTYFADWILGNKNVDDTWDEYIAELDSEGYSEMMTELDNVEPLEDMIASYTN